MLMYIAKRPPVNWRPVLFLFRLVRGAEGLQGTLFRGEKFSPSILSTRRWLEE
jgi:hypothetical protein